MDFNLLMKYCLDEINKKIKPKHPKYKLKVKYSNEYYLTMIFYMLNDINNWKFLSKLKNYSSETKYHYKTIYNKFCLWTRLGIFKDAFNNFKTNASRLRIWFLIYLFTLIKIMKIHFFYFL